MIKLFLSFAVFSSICFSVESNKDYSSIHGMEAQNSLKYNSLKCLSFNIDTNVARIYDGHFDSAFSKWRVEERISDIQKQLQIAIDKDVDVINIQEARQFLSKKTSKIIDLLTPLTQFLKNKNYQVPHKGANPDPEAFAYITAYKPGIDIIKCDLFFDDQAKNASEVGVSTYFSKTPNMPSENLSSEDRKKHNFGEMFDKSSYVTKFINNGEIFYNFNVHLGLNRKQRIKASELLNE